MSEQSNIAWTDDTWNPWRGCAKASPGCQNCYAEELVERFGMGEWGYGKPRALASGTLRNAPFKWNKKPLVCRKCGLTCLECGETTTGNHVHIGCGGKCRRRRIFSLSLGDWLDPEVPVDWLAHMLDTIRQCQALDFLLLTKRIELFDQRLTKVLSAIVNDWESEFFDTEDDAKLAAFVSGWKDGKFPNNVWLGASVEDQRRADERVPLLLDTPARVRFLSVEPLLEKLTIFYSHQRQQVDWVIIGGESGRRRRDCGVQAIADVAGQCVEAGVPVFVKQDCSLKPGQQGRIPDNVWQLKQFPSAI